MSNTDFILDFQKDDYPYQEEINEGIVRQVKASKVSGSILDVGAGRGALGEALVALGYEVYAIESNEKAASEARKKLSQVICADLHCMDKIHAALQDKKFSYIVFSDVLEHVYDPLQVLRAYAPFLAENGRILISLPNAVNWLNRLRFMFGLFNYEMTGVMDRTHIRFFTFTSAKKLLEAAQLSIEKTDCTPFIVRAFLPLVKMLLGGARDGENAKAIIESSYYKFYVKYFYPVEYWVTRVAPSLFAFRIIMVAKKL